MGLGPYPDVTLARTREKAAAHRAQSRKGADPIVAKRAERQAKGHTFREVAEEYIARNEAGWRNAKHRMPNTGSNGAIPSPPTSIRQPAICRSRRLMPDLSCRRSIQ
jgi:hypothetical protein